MNLSLASDDIPDREGSAIVSIDEAPCLIPDQHDIASSLTGNVSHTEGEDDGDSIAEVEDNMAQLRLHKIDKVHTDTPDSLLSTSDTLSSYSGCSIGGVGEPFVAVFGGVQEDSQDVWNEVDNSNDNDSAVHACSIDGSLCGSVASSQDQADESANIIWSSSAADDTCVENVESSTLSWYISIIIFVIGFTS